MPRRPECRWAAGCTAAPAAVVPTAVVPAAAARVQKDAAELLSISPRVMNYKIKTLGIEFPRGRRAAPLNQLDSPIAAAS